MISARVQIPANVAEHLRDDEIHVWHLPYLRQHGRAPLRSVLASYLGIDVQQVILTDGEHGRPALDRVRDPSLDFNWSHSGDHALIAIARSIRPGIDLECLRTRPRALDIARRYFTADEAAAVSAVPAASRSAVFLELWTAKEAVLKALGRGIAFGLNRLSISGAGGLLTLHQLDGEDPGAWQVHALHVDSSLVAALAWRGEKRRIRLWTLASDDR
ncbi:MAG: 4'-phosphopantetheinyl transferase superfamily protein [Xanthomonadaceae bacterium]|nr:4'-phosphopantetheinyl transferase superfamily protein [Xanthomonadaceae bacterium]